MKPVSLLLATAAVLLAVAQTAPLADIAPGGLLRLSETTFGGLNRVYVAAACLGAGAVLVWFHLRVPALFISALAVGVLSDLTLSAWVWADGHLASLKAIGISPIITWQYGAFIFGGGIICALIANLCLLRDPLETS